MYNPSIEDPANDRRAEFEIPDTHAQCFSCRGVYLRTEMIDAGDWTCAECLPVVMAEVG
jgi:hypothetical protein